MQNKKLIRLFHLADEYGWNKLGGRKITSIKNIGERYYLSFNSSKILDFNLSQLIGDWKPNEISFLGALVKASKALGSKGFYLIFDSELEVYFETLIRNLYFKESSNKRLDSLFFVFSVLLTDLLIEEEIQKRRISRISKLRADLIKFRKEKGRNSIEVLECISQLVLINPDEEWQRKLTPVYWDDEPDQPRVWFPEYIP